jgi:hypothetical protein
LFRNITFDKFRQRTYIAGIQFSKQSSSKEVFQGCYPVPTIFPELLMRSGHGRRLGKIRGEGSLRGRTLLREQRFGQPQEGEERRNDGLELTFL